MDKEALKAFMCGGVCELMKDDKYYYHSSVGSAYSHWTEQGNKALSEFMNIIAYKMLEADEVELTKRAKELVINGLKGEKV